MQRQLLATSHQCTHAHSASEQWLLATAPPTTAATSSGAPSTMLSSKIPLVSRVSGPACVPSQPLVGVYSPRGSKSAQQRWSWCCASTAQKRGSTSVPFQNCFGHKSETQHNRLLWNKLTPSFLVRPSTLTAVFTR